jgi:hypothetical protein
MPINDLSRFMHNTPKLWVLLIQPFFKVTPKGKIELSAYSYYEINNEINRWL